MQTPEGSPASCAKPGIPGYRRGCRCAGCRAANTAKCRAGRERRVARADTSDFEHGVSGYKNWKCRCPVCTTANTDYGRPRVQAFEERHSGHATPNSGASWKPEEIELVLRDGIPLAELAIQLGRSYRSVYAKRYTLRKTKEERRADAR